MANIDFELDTVLSVAKRELTLMSLGDIEGWLSIIAESVVYMQNRKLNSLECVLSLY